MTADSGKHSSSRVRDLKAQLAEQGYGPGGDKPAKILTADELRKRFAKGRRSRPDAPSDATGTPSSGTRTASRAVIYQRSIPRQAGPVRRHSVCAPAERVVLEDAVPGSVVCRPEGGTLYLVQRRVDEVSGAAELSERFRGLFRCPGSPLCRRIAEVLDVEAAELSGLVFMDVESTGLGSSPLFLIGTMAWQDDSFEVQQFLARNYAEERAVLHAFFEQCRERKLLITFNGKSFDWPFIRARAAANGVDMALSPAHLDLLHVSRRIWKERLPNCKLQTLERFVCRRERHGDIPGSDIPDAYHDFVRSENAWQLVDILKHNLLDLVTLADIMTRFPDEC